MLIYTPNISNRLKYVIDFISAEFFNSPIQITNDKNSFLRSAEPKINYSHDVIAEVFSITPHHLLFQNGIINQQIHISDLNGRKVFFQTPSSDFHFDIFAAIFYLLSRYEEYLPHEKDEYGRFAHTCSLAHRHQFLHLPLINYWLQDFKEALKNRFPALQFAQRSFKFIPTYDVDQVWAYRHKGFLRNVAGVLKSIFKWDWKSFKDRFQVLTGNRTDPYDAYEWLDALHLYCRLQPCYFFLIAENRGKFDKNISPFIKEFRDLIIYHSVKAKVGIHPSWQSGDDPRLLKEETGLLEFITSQKITLSRQHYIRFELPVTYRQLIDTGIKEDYSMGYGSINGFRASVASPFYWYDLSIEKQSTLKLYPFCFMDANAFYEEKLLPQQAFRQLMDFYHSIKKVNGLMTTIWHNNFLGSSQEFSGWREVYEVFLKEEVYWEM